MILLNRYIFKEIIPIFFLSNIFFIFILLLDKLVDLTDLFFSKNVPFVVIVETIVFYMPSFLMLTIPTSALLAVMTAHNRLSADSEIIVMKSIGLTPKKFVTPTILFGIFATVLAFLTSFILLPYGNQMAIYNLKRTVSYLSLKDIKKNEFYNELPNITLHVKEKIDDTNYKSLTLIDNKGDNLIVAKEGRIEQSKGAVVFDLKHGEIINGKDDKYTKVTFDRFYYVVNVEGNLKRDIKQERFMFMSELIDNFKNGKIYQYEFSKRVALPFSTFIMALLGLNMGVIFYRGGKSLNWIIALFIVFIYNLIILFSENIINIVNPIFAPWISNIIFFIISFIFLKRCIQ